MEDLGIGSDGTDDYRDFSGNQNHVDLKPSEAEPYEPDSDRDGDVDGKDLALLSNSFNSQTDLDKLPVMVGFFGLIIAHEDTDSDGMFDDGDFSGVVGDNPCVGGETLFCDDNCPEVPNIDQADADANGVGDYCESPPIDCTNIHIIDY